MFNKVLILAYTLVVTSAILITTEATEAQIVEDGLVSYWGFNSIADGVVVDSRGPNDGTVVGDVELIQGKIFRGLKFDGDGDYVNCGNDPSIVFDNKDAFSTGAWVNIEEEHDNHMVIIGKMLSYGSYRGWALWFRGLSIDQEGKVDHMQVVLRHQTHIDNGQIMLRSDSPVTRGEWMHLAMTYDGSGESKGAKLYLNGESLPLTAAGEFTRLSDTMKVDSSLNIGARGTEKGQVPNFFNGIIDEVFIYNRDLTAGEVQQNFDAKESYAVDSVYKLAITWGAIKAP